MKRRPDLIVPIRDRRQRRRILTLKNFGRVALVLGVLFLGLTLQSEIRKNAAEDYGRLFGKQVSRQTAITPPKTEIIREAPIPDETAADPLLLSAAAREQYLGVNGPLQPEPVTTSVPPTATSDVAIVNGPNGVTIVRGTAQQQRPTLSGGVFRK